MVATAEIEFRRVAVACRDPRACIPCHADRGGVLRSSVVSIKEDEPLSRVPEFSFSTVIS